MGLIAAVIAGFIASLVGAAIWAGLTVATGYQIGFVAIGVGFLVGIAVRMAGQGNTPIFGVIGAGFALFGCVLGNYFSAVGFAARHLQVDFFSALMSISPQAGMELMTATFSVMDLVFYAIAAYEGFKFSIVQGE